MLQLSRGALAAARRAPRLAARARARPRPRARCASTVAADDLRTPLLQDGAVWPVPVLDASEAAELRSQLLVETSGLLSRDFTKSDLMYYKAHLIFSAVDRLARHPAVVRAAQQALGTDEDLLLWDASVPWKPPAEPSEGGVGGGEADGLFFPWCALPDIHPRDSAGCLTARPGCG